MEIVVIGAGASGLMAAIQAARALEHDYGVHARVINLHTIKPIDRDIILQAVEETRRIITVEDHTVLGGLGTAVGEVILDSGHAGAFKKLGLNDHFSAQMLDRVDLCSVHDRFVVRACHADVKSCDDSVSCHVFS